MKRLLTAVLLLAALSPCFAQSLKSSYKGVIVSGGVQTTAAVMFAHPDEGPYPTFSAEAGYLAMHRLGESRFYFESGACLGLVNMGFGSLHSRHVRVKVPASLDYMIPMGGALTLVPSLGLGLTASYVFNYENGAADYSDPGVGVVFPHAGVSLMTDHILVGVSHDFFASVQSVVSVNGILQLNLAYLF
ncbi:MAG: hypothetical protein IKZ91_03315 [Bacteroidales bacterium]|nr:hypothetical protein [Bacteroidales bacterium]